MTTTSGIKILCVEDEDAIREALTDLLNAEGYDVVWAENVREALGQLRQDAFDLIVADYMLPDGTGTQLIKQATSDGLASGAAKMLITAHPSPEQLADVRTFRKPLDVDEFLEQVHAVLAPARERALEQAKAQLAPNRGSAAAAAPSHVELALYISSAASPSSLKALRTVQRVLDEYERGAVTLIVHDLSRGSPPTAEEDRIAFTPTLVKRSPAPRTWVIGSLRDPQILRDLLDEARLQRT